MIDISRERFRGLIEVIVKVLNDIYQGDSALAPSVREAYLLHKWVNNVRFVAFAQFFLLVTQLMGYRNHMLRETTLLFGEPSFFLIALSAASLSGLLLCLSTVIFAVSVPYRRLITYGYLAVYGFCVLGYIQMDLIADGGITNFIFYCGIIGAIMLFSWKEYLVFVLPVAVFTEYCIYTLGVQRFGGGLEQTHLVVWIAVVLLFISQKLYYANLRAFLELEQRSAAHNRLVDLNEHLERISETDPLTQINNRRALDRHGGQLWNHCLRQREYITVMILDIDYFKPYNDTFGHPQGDVCLQTVAGLLRQELRRSFDILARYGGEEFAVVLGFQNPAQAITQAERLRMCIEKHQIETANTSVSPYVTISVGLVTMVAQDNYSLANLFSLADQCLYAAKNAGRNRVAVWENNTCVLVPASGELFDIDLAFEQESLRDMENRES